MASNVDINLNARINDFESAFNRVYKHFETLAYKGKDAATSMQQSFSKINETGKREIDSLQKAFNSLSINTDFSMNVQKESLVRAKHFFLEQFLEIRNSGQASADEIARAYAAMNSKIAQLNASSPQGKADAAAKAKVIAQEQAAAQELANINKLRAASVNAEVQKILAAEKAAAQKVIAEQEAAKKMLALHEQALMMNQQFDKQMVISREMALRKMTLAHEEAARMNKLFNEGSLTGTGEIIKKNTEGMNLFGLASVAAIAKIQILYSLINTVMSAIGQAPGIAIDAIENFNSAAITNAALITSMQKGVADIGVAYQNNKKYTVAVQEVLEKMDAETSATAENLTAMNRIFIGHGILIDINNKKQLEGFRNTANAIAALTHGSANQALQFPQEIKGLLEMEDKPGNQLFRALNNLDNGKLKEHLAEWDKIAKKTGDYGLILEKIAPLLQGFSAAQGDINALWETTKTTLLTIRNGVLREALQPAFNDLVNTMKEIVAWATANKSAIADWIETAYKLAKAFGGALWSVLSTISKIGEPVIWAAITAGLTAAGVGVSALSSLMTALGVKVTIATGGINLMVAALATAAMYVAKITAVNWSTEQDLNKRVTAIRAAGKYEAADFTPNMLKQVLDVNKNATNEDINKWLKSGALNISTRNGQQVFDINKAAVLAKSSEAVPMPSGLTGRGLGKDKKPKEPKAESVSDFNSFVDMYTKMLNEAEPDEFLRKVNAIDDKFKEMQFRYDKLSISEKKDFDAKYKSLALVKEEQQLRAINEEADKREKAWNLEMKHFQEEATKRQKEQNQEAYNVAQDAIKIKLDELDLQERLNKISKPDADVERIRLNKELVDASNDYLITLEKSDKKWKEVEGTVRKLNASINELTAKLPLDIVKQQQEKMDILGANFGTKNPFDSYTSSYTKTLNDIAQRKAQFGQDDAKANAMQNGMYLDALRDTTSMATDIMMKGNKEQFEAGKALAISMAVINGGLAVTKALATMPPPMSFVVAGLTAAMTGVQIATISSQQYQGREFGGPVNAGQTYIVGEKRPELFTPGASGVITPYVPQGGATVNQVISIDARGADAGVLARIDAAMKQAKDQAKNEILASMNRGGSFATASGRI